MRSDNGGCTAAFFVTVLAGSEQARVALYTCDEKRRIKKTWLKGCPFPLGERLEVEWSEVDEETPPLLAEEYVPRKRDTKLECFRRLETELKEKGIL